MKYIIDENGYLHCGRGERHPYKYTDTRSAENDILRSRVAELERENYALKDSMVYWRRDLEKLKAERDALLARAALAAPKESDDARAAWGWAENARLNEGLTNAVHELSEMGKQLGRVTAERDALKARVERLENAARAFVLAWDETDEPTGDAIEDLRAALAGEGEK